MKCPVCSQEMVNRNFGISVDVCENGCKGMWFDQGELAMLDEKNEGVGSLLETALRYPRDNQGRRGQIQCPKCSIPMHTHKYKRAKEVNVDECYKCGGYFLDSGELTEIRDHYMTDSEIEAYTDQLVAMIPAFSKALHDVEEKTKRFDAIQRYSKFMTLNYWRKKFQ